jgi:hypothetical protein
LNDSSGASIKHHGLWITSTKDACTLALTSLPSW